jgi:hypothetical protein
MDPYSGAVQSRRKLTLDQVRETQAVQKLLFTTFDLDQLMQAGQGCPVQLVECRDQHALDRYRAGTQCRFPLPATGDCRSGNIASLETSDFRFIEDSRGFPVIGPQL